MEKIKYKQEKKYFFSSITWIDGGWSPESSLDIFFRFFNINHLSVWVGST